MAPFQCGKTETTLNVVGYYIQHEPAPMLSVLEEKDKAEDWSKNRLSSMLAETPCLNGLVRNSRGKDSQNTLTFKEFPGGYLAIAGAGSEAQLTSRPIRVVIMDELDKWKSLRAGDPEQLAANRTITYRHRKKIIRVSTPRDKGISRIEDAYLRSDQRKFYVPCPHCQHKQVLYMGKETDAYGLKWTYKEGAVKELEMVWYECEACHQAIHHSEKKGMLSQGRWKSERPFNGHAGFWMNVLYSPWVTWTEVVKKFIELKNQPDTLKTFVNEWMAETWEERYDKVDEGFLYRRRENYNRVPYGAGILTAGVDVQDNRLEASLWAWGRGEESWLIEHKIFYGDPAQVTDQCYRDLDAWLQAPVLHENGAEMKISAAFVDSGSWTKTVYMFCHGKQGRRIFAIKGIGGKKKTISERPKRQKGKADLIIIAVDMVKEILWRRLRIVKPENQDSIAGYIHFSANVELEYFSQLTAESPTVKQIQGRPVRTWILPGGKRCETWDCFVYAYAAVEFLKIRDIGRYVDKYAEPRRIEAVTEPEAELATVPAETRSSIPSNKKYKLHRRVYNRGGL